MDQKQKENIEFHLRGAGATIGFQNSLNQLESTATAFEQLDSLADRLASDPTKIVPIECHQEINKISPNCTSDYKESFQILSNKECLTSDEANIVINDIRASQIKMANRTIAISVAFSVVTIGCQVIQLREIWKVIKDAQNVTEESKKIIAEMGTNLKQLENSVGEMEPWLKQHETEDDERKRDLLIMKVNLKYSEVRELYLETRNQLSQLRIVVNGKLESFEVFQIGKKRDLLLNSAISSAQLFTNMAQMGIFQGIASPFALGASILAVVGLSLVTAANLYTISIGEDTLKQLRKQLADIDQLELTLLPLKERIDKIKQWLQDNLMNVE